MTRAYRAGAIGALMDEYERATAELAQLILGLADTEFEIVRDRQTEDDEYRSIQTVVNHVVRSGYGYADYAREAFSVDSFRPEIPLVSRLQSLEQLSAMLAYTAATLEGHWQMPYDQISAVQIQSQWAPTYDLEQMLEHAIVHVLRHRRQIERFLHEPQFAPAGQTQDLQAP